MVRGLFERAASNHSSLRKRESGRERSNHGVGPVVMRSHLAFHAGAPAFRIRSTHPTRVVLAGVPDRACAIQQMRRAQGVGRVGEEQLWTLHRAEGLQAAKYVRQQMRHMNERIAWVGRGCAVQCPSAPCGCRRRVPPRPSKARFLTTSSRYRRGSSRGH